MGNTILDEAVVKRLQVARFELEDGRRELAALTEAGAYKAIKSFHDALETFLIAVALHRNVPPAHRHFHEYPKALKGATGFDFKHTTVLNRVNALRTPAKHDAIYPSPDAVRQISAQLDSVFEDNCIQYLGVSFFSVKLASTVGHEHARREIVSAEDAIEQRDYATALGLLRVAFDVFCYDQIGYSRRPLISDRLESIANRFNGLLPHELRQINSEWERLVSRFALVELGINLADHTRFMSMTPNVFIPGDPRNRTIYQMGTEDLIATAENASFALAFVLQTIHRVEGSRRVRSASSLYQVRAKVSTPMMVWSGDQRVEVGQLHAGDEIADAHFALGPDGTEWLWEQADQHVAVRFDSCEIISEETREEFARRVQQEAMQRAERKRGA